MAQFSFTEEKIFYQLTEERRHCDEIWNILEEVKHVRIGLGSLLNLNKSLSSKLNQAATKISEEGTALEACQKSLAEVFKKYGGVEERVKSYHKNGTNVTISESGGSDAQGSRSASGNRTVVTINEAQQDNQNRNTSGNGTVVTISEGNGTGSGLTQNDILDMYKNGRRVDTSVYDRSISVKNSSGKNVITYKSSGGCTWYAISRYNQVNGSNKELIFSTRGSTGNADQIDDMVDKRFFTVSETRADYSVKGNYNYSAIKANSLAVSDIANGGRSGKHVVYIEGVYDGNVYYTDGAYGKAESTYGKMKCMRIDEFCWIYEHIITAK